MHCMSGTGASERAERLAEGPIVRHPDEEDDVARLIPSARMR